MVDEVSPRGYWPEPQEKNMAEKSLLTKPEIPKRTVFDFAGSNGRGYFPSRTVVTHLGTLFSGNLQPDRQSWLVTRYVGGRCAMKQIDDCTVTDPALFAGPGEVLSVA
jgi:hypothetical protein